MVRSQDVGIVASLLIPVYARRTHRGELRGSITTIIETVGKLEGRRAESRSEHTSATCYGGASLQVLPARRHESSG